MNRLTKSITLVLISSSLALYGCARRDEEERREAGGGQGPHGATGLHSGGSHLSGRSRLGGAGSVRGGFGHSGHGAIS